MDQLFALGSISTRMKILGPAPDEISTVPARIADIPTRHFTRLVTLIGRTPACARLRHVSGDPGRVHTAQGAGAFGRTHPERHDCEPRAPSMNTSIGRG